jgi:radical SAM superfamily enzyme YgiQ (UPF0313 family)
MKIAFVFVPYRHKRFSENLRVVDDDFGVLPPINLAWAAAMAESAGHTVMMVDAQAERLSIEETIDRLRAFGAEAVGFYFSTYMFHDTRAWAGRIRTALGVPILAGGINVGLYPAETMSHPEIDFALNGQAYESLPRLLDALQRGVEPAGIPGVCYRKGDELVMVPPDTRLRAFARYPFPARHLLPNERYFSITSQLRNFTVILTQMGCPQKCSFCPISRVPYQARPVDTVLAEVDECVLRHDVREIDFFDADFVVARRRAEDLCRGLIDRKHPLEWSCRACVDSLDRDMLRLMADAGCKKVYIGIETASPDSLRRMNKRLEVSRVQQVIRDAQDLGIHPLGFFMTGVPGETRQTLRNTIRYSVSLGLDYAQFSRTIAKPGTGLHDEVTQATGSDYWREWVLGRMPERRLPNPWTELTDREIELWTQIAYLTFYFRPTYIGKAMFRFRSLDETVRSVRTAARMLIHAVRKDW